MHIHVVSLPGVEGLIGVIMMHGYGVGSLSYVAVLPFVGVAEVIKVTKHSLEEV